MSYSSNISISARHASDLCGVIRLAPSLWGTAPSSSSISCSTKLQQPISALCFDNTSAFRFKRSRNFSKSPSPIFPFKCSISGKSGLSDSSSYDEGRSGKFEQLDKPSSVSDFIENTLKFYLYWHDKDRLSHYVSSSFVSPHSRSSSAKRNQASFHAGLKPWCPVCSIAH